MKKIFFLFLLLFITGCFGVTKVGKSEYLKYLNNKYSNDSFSIVKASDRCNWFNEGFCTYVAKSQKYGEFLVSANQDKKFSDDYLFYKYKYDITNYYEYLFSKIMQVKFVLADTNNYIYLDGEATFDDVLFYEDGNYILTVKLTNDIDINTMEEKIKDLLKQNNINNIYRIKISYSNCSDEYNDDCYKSYNIDINRKSNITDKTTK